jgi:MFS family permease
MRRSIWMLALVAAALFSGPVAAQQRAQLGPLCTSDGTPADKQIDGIIPAYVLTVRELFPASEASWRIPTLLLFSGGGMAAGGWIAGLLYDHLGYYVPAFAVGIGANILNLLMVSVLVGRQRHRAVHA